MIKYLGKQKNNQGDSVFVFLINGLQKEVKQFALKQFPGCYEALPSSVKSQIQSDRSWLSKI